MIRRVAQHKTVHTKKVMMPEMDGHEATRLLKADPRYRGVPVVGLTGNCDTEGTRACLESGMLAVLGKPIDTAALFQLLLRLLEAKSNDGEALKMSHSGLNQVNQFV